MTQKSFLPLINKIVTIVLIQSVAIYASSDQSNQSLKVIENKRITATICADSMNRISIANDRITQIFGDEGTFESQNDEATGQLFLKPTAENGSKNLSLTLITEQGITQDLKLIPTSKTPQTLVLTRDPKSSSPINVDSNVQDINMIMGTSNQPNTLNDSNEPRLSYANALPIQEQLLHILKQAITDQLQSHGEEIPDRHPPHIEGISLTPSQSWQAGPYIVGAVIVENTSEASIELEEKNFYQIGDLALSFYVQESEHPSSEKRVLSPEGQAILYIVRYGKISQP